MTRWPLQALKHLGVTLNCCLAVTFHDEPISKSFWLYPHNLGRRGPRCWGTAASPGVRWAPYRSLCVHTCPFGPPTSQQNPLKPKPGHVPPLLPSSSNPTLRKSQNVYCDDDPRCPTGADSPTHPPSTPRLCPCPSALPASGSAPCCFSSTAGSRPGNPCPPSRNAHLHTSAWLTPDPLLGLCSNVTCSLWPNLPIFLNNRNPPPSPRLRFFLSWKAYHLIPHLTFHELFLLPLLCVPPLKNGRRPFLGFAGQGCVPGTQNGGWHTASAQKCLSMNESPDEISTDLIRNETVTPSLHFPRT